MLLLLRGACWTSAALGTYGDASDTAGRGLGVPWGAQGSRGISGAPNVPCPVCAVPQSRRCPRQALPSARPLLSAALRCLQ